MNLPKRTQGVWKKKIKLRFLANEAEKKRIIKILPLNEWTCFEKIIDVFIRKTRAGKLLQNAFSVDFKPTPTGKRMKRFLKRHTNGEIHTYCHVAEFLLSASDNSLKDLFGRKFLNIGNRNRKMSGYNLFMVYNGFENASRLWNMLDDSEKEEYNHKAASSEPGEKPLLERRKNLWQVAVKKYHEENKQTLFSPIKKDTEEYNKIQEIYAQLKEEQTGFVDSCTRSTPLPT